MSPADASPLPLQTLRRHCLALARRLAGPAALVVDVSEGIDTTLPGHSDLRVWPIGSRSGSVEPIGMAIEDTAAPAQAVAWRELPAGGVDLAIWLNAPVQAEARTPRLQALAGILKPDGLLVLGWARPLPRGWKPDRTMASLFPSARVLHRSLATASLLTEADSPTDDSTPWHLERGGATSAYAVSTADSTTLVLLGKAKLPTLGASVLVGPPHPGEAWASPRAQTALAAQLIETLQSQLQELRGQRELELRRTREDMDHPWFRRLQQQELLLRGSSTQLDAARQRIVELDRALRDAQRALQEATEAHAAAAIEHAGRTAELNAQVESERQARQALRISLERQLADCQAAADARVSALTEAAQGTATRLAQLQADCEQLRDLWSRAREDHAAADAARAVVAADLTATRQALEIERAAHEATRSIRSELERSLAAADRSIGELEAALADTASRLRDVTREAERARAREQEELRDCQTELESLRSEWQQAQIALQQSMAREDAAHRLRRAEMEAEARWRADLAQVVQTLSGAFERWLERGRLGRPASQDTAEDPLRELLSDLRQRAGVVPALPAVQTGADKARVTDLGELLALPDDRFVQAAYVTVLGRDADPDGGRHYSQRLRQGESRLRVLADLRWSAEGRSRAPALPMLDDALRWLRRSRVPIWGRRARARLDALLVGVPSSKGTPPADGDAGPGDALFEVKGRIEQLARGSALLAEAVPVAVALGRADPDGRIDAWSAARELVDCSVEDFINLAYRLLLRREPTRDERRDAAARIAGGASRVHVLNQLTRQPRLTHRKKTDAVVPVELASTALAAQAAEEVPRLTIALLSSHGSTAAVRMAIRRIAAQRPAVPTELLVVGTRTFDAAATAGPLPLRWVEPDASGGELAACDAAVAAAQGEIVVFVPGNVESEERAWDELVHAFSIHAGVAAVQAGLVTGHQDPCRRPGAVRAIPEPRDWRGLALKVHLLRSIGKLADLGSLGALARALRDRGYRLLEHDSARLRSWGSPPCEPDVMPPSAPALLVVEPRLLQPDRDAGSLCVFNLMLAWRERGWTVRFACLSADVDAQRQLGLLRRCGIELVASSHEEIDSHLVQSGSNYAAVMLCRPDMAHAYTESVRHHAAGARLFYFAHDLHHLRMARSHADPGIVEAIRQRELAACRSADVTLLLSDVERQELAARAPEVAVRVLPMPHDFTRRAPGARDRAGALFVGHFGHEPNADAAAWLADEIVPALRRRGCDIEIILVGADPPSDVIARAPAGMRFTGPVDDLTPFLQGCRLALAPLRFGAGIKGKVIRAVAAGVPLVATPMALEGLPLCDGEHVMLANDAESFAAAIAQLDADASLRSRLAEAGFALLKSQHGPEATDRALAELLQWQALPDQPTGYLARFLRESICYIPTAEKSKLAAGSIPL